MIDIITRPGIYQMRNRDFVAINYERDGLWSCGLGHRWRSDGRYYPQSNHNVDYDIIVRVADLPADEL